MDKRFRCSSRRKETGTNAERRRRNAEYKECGFLCSKGGEGAAFLTPKSKEPRSDMFFVGKGRSRTLFRPSLRDLGIRSVGSPTLKSWAIVETSFRDENVMLAGLNSSSRTQRDIFESGFN